MAVKKSELYSSLWASCDSLRGGAEVSRIMAKKELIRKTQEWKDQLKRQIFLGLRISYGQSSGAMSFLERRRMRNE